MKSDRWFCHTSADRQTQRHTHRHIHTETDRQPGIFRPERSQYIQSMKWLNVKTFAIVLQKKPFGQFCVKFHHSCTSKHFITLIFSRSYTFLQYESIPLNVAKYFLFDLRIYSILTLYTPKVTLLLVWGWDCVLSWIYPFR